MGRYKRIWLSIFFITGLLSLSCDTMAAEQISLTNIHALSLPSQTHLILDFNHNANYKLFTLDHPPRVVIDLPNVKLTTSLNKILMENSAIVHIRAGHPTPTILRLVLDLAKPLHTQASSQTSEKGKVNQIIVELSDHPFNGHQTVAHNGNLQQTQQWLQESLTHTNSDNASENHHSKVAATHETSAPETTMHEKATRGTETSEPMPKPVKTTSNKPHTAKNTDKTDTADNDESTGNTTLNVSTTPAVTKTTITAPPSTGRRSVVVIIDPGHGGKDPGTSGSLGVREKDVVLAIATDLSEILAKQPGVKPLLTRNRDYFVPLRGRLAMARQSHGDIFVAIHADAYQDPYATGASVFALSAHGASSEAARWLAEKENYSELGGVSLSDKSDMLRSVLIDLSQTATISSSMQLGSNLIQQLGQIGNLHYKNVEQAPFMVLKSPDIPSVLVETGFLSNPEEQARLHNPVDQEQIANALAAGIMNYFKKNPPPGTLLAALQTSKNER